MTASITSRTYDPREKRSPWFQSWQARIFKHNSFRDWEVPAIMRAIAPDASHRYLSIGGVDCSATYAVGLIAEVHTIDVNARVIDWREWSPGVKPMVIQKKGEIPCPDAYFDVVFSVSSIEHSKADQDIETARQIGRVLKLGGKFILTTEFGPFVDWDPIVGGRIYDEQSLEERIVKPACCEWVGERHFATPTLEDTRRNGIPGAVNPFWPALLILRRRHA